MHLSEIRSAEVVVDSLVVINCIPLVINIKVYSCIAARSLY